METVKLSFDLSQIKELQDAINKFGAANKETFPAISESFHRSAQYAQNIWNNYLLGGELEGIEPLDKPLNPKNINLHVVDKGDFESAVVSNSNKLDEIQHGSQPVFYDMKQTHPYGRKSRVSKDGIPYLIIPFRWGTPNGKGTDRAHSFFSGTIPLKEYNVNVRGMDISSRTGKIRFEKNARGENIARSRYNWKDRLEGWDDRSAGMVRMEDYGMNKAGEIVKRSTYFTFRIISAKSPANKWLYWKDGKNAVDMLGALEKTTRPGIEKIIDAGIKADLGI